MAVALDGARVLVRAALAGRRSTMSVRNDGRRSNTPGSLTSAAPAGAAPVRSPAVGEASEGTSVGRRNVSSGSPWEPVVGFSRAVRVGNVVHVAGTGPVEADGSCRPGARDQAARCFEIIAAALAEAGAGLSDVVRTRMYVTEASVMDAVGSAHHDAVGDVAPAATMVVVAGLADPRWLVEIEAEAIVEDAT